MSERLHHNPEHRSETIDTSVESAHNAERLRKQAERTPEVSKEKVEHLRHKAKEEAISGKETTVGEQQETGSSSPMVTRGLKQQSYKKTLQRVRVNLSPSQRLLSRVIHQQTIEKISNVSAQTAARPSGLLGGAIFAFLGSLGLVILSKRVGFTYNYLVFFVLFVGGFGLGLIIELLLRVLRPSKR